MIFRELVHIRRHYSHKPVIELIVYRKDDKEYSAIWYGGDLTIAVMPNTRPISEILKGTQFSSFFVGDWKGGKMYMYIVGKRGYVPKEDLPNE